jgi:hypothetical protein
VLKRLGEKMVELQNSRNAELEYYVVTALL